MIKTIITAALFVLLSGGQSAFGQAVDNLAKNTKQYDDEQARFESELKTNPDSGEVYWKHANVTAGFTFNAQRNAWKFYEKALSMDSSKAVYFIDYGKFLYETSQLNDARSLYERALKLFPANQELKNSAEVVKRRILKNEENRKLGDFGKAPMAQTKAANYSKIIDFEALAKQTRDKKSPFYYDKLMALFRSDLKLTDEQVYMLLIGFAQQEQYKPYTQEARLVYDLNSEEHFDAAIAKANELLKVNPLLPSLYRELVYAYRKKGDTAQANYYLAKMQSILNAMLYTGDGSCDKPYVAFWVPEEYTMLKYLGYKKTGAVDTGTCGEQMADKIEVTNLTTNDKAVICFNIVLVFKKTMGR
jgi:tetratricopeptide (TPR) repeat protein